MTDERASLFSFRHLRQQIATHPSTWPCEELSSLVEIVEIVKARRTRFADSYRENRTDEERNLDELLARWEP